MAWDKDDAPCRKEGIRCGEGCGPGEVRKAGQGTRAERTSKIFHMVVTLDVSKLSDWLNADARCPQSEGGHRVRDEVRAGRRESVWGGGGASGVL